MWIDPGSLLMQLNGTITTPIINTAPQGNDVAATITALIIAIGGMVGAVAAILQQIGQRKELGKHGEALREAADTMQNIGDHIISSKEDIKSLAEITYEFSPEQAKTIVNQQNIRLLELTKKLQDAQEKLKQLPPVLKRI